MASTPPHWVTTTNNPRPWLPQRPCTGRAVTSAPPSSSTDVFSVASVSSAHLSQVPNVSLLQSDFSGRQSTQFVSTTNNHRHTWQNPNYNHHPFLPQRASSSSPPSSSSATVAPAQLSKTPNFSPLQTPKSDLSTDFSGRRSTRFVSKMHFGRPKTTMATRHSSADDDALQNVFDFSGDYEMSGFSLNWV